MQHTPPHIGQSSEDDEHDDFPDADQQDLSSLGNEETAPGLLSRAQDVDEDIDPTLLGAGRRVRQMYAELRRRSFHVDACILISTNPTSVADSWAPDEIESDELLKNARRIALTDARQLFSIQQHLPSTPGDSRTSVTTRLSRKAHTSFAFEHGDRLFVTTVVLDRSKSSTRVARVRHQIRKHLGLPAAPRHNKQ
jgi:hypothetical protein